MNSDYRQDRFSQRGVNGLNENLPFLLVVAALVIWFGAQYWQAVKVRDELNQAFETQETQLQNANKLRKTLTSLATGTKQLANQGNANAAQIVNALTQRGIKINDPPEAAQVPTPPTPPAPPAIPVPPAR